MSTKIEFAVQMTCEACVSAVKYSLKDIAGIEAVDVNLEKGSVVVDTNLATGEVTQHLEKSGRKVVLKGLAGILAAVAILDTGNRAVQGVVRFAQINSDICIVDGTIDGLKPGSHGLCIHETGDLSKGCDSIGECYNPNDTSEVTDRIYGNLESVTAGDNGRATFRFQDNVVKLDRIIGRSLVITEKSENNGGNCGSRLACGIIARSSGLFENPKTICACDGVSIWDEQQLPKKSVL